MRPLILAAFLFATTPAGAETITIDTRDGPRHALITDSGQRPAPLVIVLHGAMGTPEQVRGYAGWDAVARREGLMIAYPEGLARTWNDERPPGARKYRPRAGTADDVGFIRALVERLVHDGRADPARLYVTGLSNGGHMTYRLACEAGDLFAGAAAIIANVGARLTHACSARPIPILLMNGTADRLSPFGGEPRTDPNLTILSTPETFGFFARRNGCRGTASHRLPDRDPTDGSTIVEMRGTGCARATALYRVEGGGHQSPALDPRPLPSFMERLLGPRNHDIDMAETVWRFFQSAR